MKKSFAVMLSFSLLVIIFLQGCGVANQPYVKKDASEATPLKMIRYETPNVRVYTTGGMVGTIVTSAVLFGIIGGGLGYAAHYVSTIEPDTPERLDFGKLVMDKFVERSKEEIPNWPEMIVQEKAVDNANAKDSNLPVETSSYLIELLVNDIKIEEGSGLGTKTTITMKDTEGKIIWEKGYVYDCTTFNRVNNFYTLKSHKYKKLNEEFIFAAEQTVNDFITHFNDSLPVTPYASAKHMYTEQTQPAKKIETTTANPTYSNIKGIVLKDGTVIEGQIIEIKKDVLIIRTKDKRLLSYDFMNDVKNYIYAK